MIRQRLHILWVALVACLIIISACKKDPVSYPPGSNEAINQWMKGEMEQYYYWTGQLSEPSEYSISPTTFFADLLLPEDRFSSIVQTLNEDSYGKSMANTFGFDIIAVEQGNQTLHLINHVVPNSNAALAGLARGDSIREVNGQSLLADKISTIIDQTLQGSQVSIVLQNGKKVDVAASYVSQPVIYHGQLLGSRSKTAYLFLSHFDFSGAYDLLDAIKRFKNAEADELILDLRYNPGGQVSFAAFCALLIAPVDPTAIFVRYRGNSRIGTLDDSFQDALGRQPDGYSFQVRQLEEARLTLRRVYILSSGHTASAAELLINNLRPYIAIVHIGEPTLGKDMASVTRTTPAVILGGNASWHILPMVYKMYNSNNEGDYAAGLYPQQQVSEYETLPLYPFGDARDPLLARALAATGDENATTAATSSTKRNPTARPSLRFESRPYEYKPIIVDF